MTDISIANGLNLSKRTAQAPNSRSENKAPVGFMESLRKTNCAAVDMGKSVNISANASVNAPKNSSANTPSDKSVKNIKENTCAKPNTDINAGAEETEIVSEQVSSGGNVKVDEETVKELEQLKGLKEPEAEKAAEETDGEDLALVSGESSEKDGGETEKSLLARAEEALANAMLKAFMELNDPGKNKEEFEEKLLLFLMKLVDGINGKTDTDSPFGSDKDEEKLGGALMQIIENMLENAKKNVEMSGEPFAQTGAAFIGNYFLDMNETAVTEDPENSDIISTETASKKLYPGQSDFDRGGKIGTNPVIPPVHTHSSGIAAAEPQSAVKSNSDAVAGVKVSEQQLNGVSFAPDAETSSMSAAAAPETVITAVNGSRKPMETVSAVNDESAGLKAPVPASRQVMPLGNDQPEGTALFNGYNGDNFTRVETDLPSVNMSDVSKAFDFSGANNAAAEESLIPLTRGEAKLETYPEVKETAVPGTFTSAEQITLSETDSEPSESPLPAADKLRLTNVPVDEGESELYGQIAENVYKDVKRTLDSTKEADTHPTRVNAADSCEANPTETGESEFDELKRLFGLKNEEKTFLSMEEESEYETAADNANERGDGSKEKDISVSDIKLVSTKAIEAPLPRSLMSGGAVNRVVTQVINHILANIPAKEQETTLMVTLNPETLGKISIKLVENAGKLSVTISAENKETAAILASRAENVQESMRDQGTQLEKYQVVYGAEQDGKAEQQNYEGSSKNPYVRNIEGEKDDDGEFEKILRGAV